jgi:hypothetical protein
MCYVLLLFHVSNFKNPTKNIKLSVKSKPNNDDNNNVIFEIDSNKKTREFSETDSLSSSDKENDTSSLSSCSSNYSNLRQDFTDGFQYKTINGCMIRSVVPPGKGVKVDYKVSNFCECFGM